MTGSVMVERTTVRTCPTVTRPETGRALGSPPVTYRISSSSNITKDIFLTSLPGRQNSLLVIETPEVSIRGTSNNMWLIYYSKDLRDPSSGIRYVAYTQHIYTVCGVYTAHIYSMRRIHGTYIQYVAYTQHIYTVCGIIHITHTLVPLTFY